MEISQHARYNCQFCGKVSNGPRASVWLYGACWAAAATTFPRNPRGVDTPHSAPRTAQPTARDCCARYGAPRNMKRGAYNVATLSTLPHPNWLAAVRPTSRAVGRRQAHSRRHLALHPLPQDHRRWRIRAGVSLQPRVSLVAARERTHLDCWIAAQHPGFCPRVWLPAQLPQPSPASLVAHRGAGCCSRGCVLATLPLPAWGVFHVALLLYSVAWPLHAPQILTRASPCLVPMPAAPRPPSPSARPPAVFANPRTCKFVHPLFAMP